MSKLLMERWLRLSGILNEAPEGGFVYDPSKDTGGIEIVSELSFCVSLANGASEVDENQVTAGGQRVTDESGWTQWQKYAPEMKKVSSEGGNELAKYLKVGSNMAEVAKTYIENTYSGTKEDTQGTPPSITGVRHAGATNNTGVGSGTEDAVVNFTDGDGKIQALGISLKAFDRSTNSPGSLIGQSLGLSDMFANYYTTSSDDLKDYLDDLKEVHSDYTPPNPFRIVTDWCWMEAGGDLRDAMNADFDDEDSSFRKSVPTGKKVKFSLTQNYPQTGTEEYDHMYTDEKGDEHLEKRTRPVFADKPTAPAFSTQDTGEDFDLFSSPFMDDEVKADLRSQRSAAAARRVPNPANMYGGSNNPRRFYQNEDGEERASTEFEDNDAILGRFPNSGLARRTGPGGTVPDRGVVQNRLRVHLMEELGDLCDGGFSKAFAAHCLRRSMNRIVIQGNLEGASVYVTEQEKYDRMEEALKKPNSEWTFEKKGDTGFVVKCGGVAQVSGNLKIDAGRTYGVGTGATKVESKYSLARFFGGFGTKTSPYSVSATFQIV